MAKQCVRCSTNLNKNGYCPSNYCEQFDLGEECPNCGEKFDGIECHECGFDTGAHDPNWD